MARSTHQEQYPRHPWPTKKNRRQPNRSHRICLTELKHRRICSLQARRLDVKLSPMQHREEQTQSVRWLLASRCQGVISTHSLEHPGYPFGSVVPYVLNNSGMPLMLLSHLSQHTKNLEANAQCGLTVAETGTGDIQQLGRLSAIGDVDKVDGAQDAERYFRYFPQSRMYHDELGFKFSRVVPRRFHWNGGFATASWFGTDRIVRANPLTADEEAGIVAHMNGDHADAVLHYWRRAGNENASEAAVLMVGIDAEGMDLRRDDRLYRIPLSRTIDSTGAARTVLVDMAQSATD